MAEIGFLGLGTMGRAMAGRLLETGHDVVVWNRSEAPVAELVAAGARAAASPVEALAVPLSVSMLADDAAAEAVLSAENLGGGAGRLHVCMASVSPDASDRLAAVHAAAGVGYLAAPVLGRSTVAEAGQLNVLVAGPAEDIERARPCLEAMGKRVWELGTQPRTANVVKVAVNYTIIHALQAMGEGVALVETEGLDGSLFTDLLASTLFAGVVYQGYGDMIGRRRYTPPGFTMTLGSKDLGLAEEVARTAGLTLPTAPALRRVFDAALADDELGEADWSAIAEVTRRGLLDTD